MNRIIKIILLPVSLIIIAFSARAATFVVDNIGTTGVGTLDDAVTQANTTPGQDTIYFYLSGGTIMVPTGGYIISDDVSIFGPGIKHLKVSGNGMNSIFTVNASVTLFEVYSLSMINGKSTNATGGAAISCATGTTKMNIQDCLFKNNTSVGNGGAIHFEKGQLWLFGCSFIDNHSDNEGGHLYIDNLPAGYNADIINSTFAGTMTYISGGNYTAGVQGGAISIGPGVTGGFVNIVNNTLFNNACPSPGGGLYTYTTNVNFTNNLLYLNNQFVTGINTGRELFGPAGSTGYNAFYDLQGTNGGFTPNGELAVVGSGTGIAFWYPANMPTDITETGRGHYIYRIPLESNIIDKGNPIENNGAYFNTTYDSKDVRGVIRVLDGNKDNNRSIDIGSFEYSPYTVKGNILGHSLDSVINIINADATTPTAAPPYYIDFNLSGTSPFVCNDIVPTSITASHVIIDGYTQPGAYEHFERFEGNINVFFKSTNTSTNLININGGTYHEICGLAIGGYNYGITTNNDDSLQVWGNYIGLGPTGDNMTYLNNNGINVNNSLNAVIGGPNGAGDRNVISGNYTGLFFSNAQYGQVITNWFGYTHDGLGAAGNTFAGLQLGSSFMMYIGSNNDKDANFYGYNNMGLYVSNSNSSYFQNNSFGLDVDLITSTPNTVGARFENSSSNSIGGNAHFPYGGNVFDNSTNYGLEIHGTSSYNHVYSNFIGVNHDGVGIQGNGIGVYIHDFAYQNTIGGYTDMDVNFIGGNTNEAVKIDATTGSNNYIQYNVIGLDTSGYGVVPNGLGINCFADCTLIQRNYIAGNNGSAIVLNANNCSIISNGIGLDINSSPQPNGTLTTDHAIDIQSGNVITIDSNTVTNSPGAGINIVMSDSIRIRADTIFGNALDGIYVGSGDVIPITNNIIHDNGELGIDLGTNGVGGYSTVNLGINMPVLNSVANCGTLTYIEGTFSDANFPGQNIKLQFYVNPNGTQDPSGSGEGYSFLMEQDVTTDAAGNASFSINVPMVPLNDWVTVTASSYDSGTTPYRTSEFAVNMKCVGVTTSAINIMNVSCAGGNNGYADASTVGATANSWDWYTSSSAWLGNAPNWSTFTAGSYYVVANIGTGGSACRDTSAVFNITEPAPIVQTVSFTNETCLGSNDGTVTTTTSGGSGIFVYQWYNSASTSVGTTPTVTALSPDTYYCLVTDGNGCSNTSSTVTVAPGSSPTGTVTAVNESCPGYNDGQIIVNISGGTPPWQISIDGGTTFNTASSSTTQTISSLAPGTYQVGIQDVNGCYHNNGPFGINPSPRTIGFTVSPGTTACLGQTINFADTATGWGVPSYNWSFGDGGTSTVLNPSYTYLTAGTFTTTLTMSEGTCTISDSVPMTINDLQVVIDSLNQISCNGGADGILAASVTAGSGSYSYSWSNSATTDTISGLAAGSYTVTVTDNTTGCTNSASHNLVDPPLENASFSLSANAVCQSSGPVTATITGTTGGTFSATPSGLSLNFSTGDITPTTSTPGSYTVSYTTACGISSSVSFTVQAPDSVYAGADTTVCAGSTVPLNATSTASSTNWTTSGDGTFDFPNTLNPNYTFGPTDNANGSVTLTISSNASGSCPIVSDNLIVTIQPNPVPAITGNTTVCAGTTGEPYSITGNAGDTYNWTVSGGTIASGNGTTNISVDWATSGNGTVNIVETTAAGCSGNNGITVVINATPTVTFGPVPNQCQNGTAYTLTEGAPSGGSYTGTGVISSPTFQFDPSISGTGTFALTYTYTDVNGCSDSATSSVTVDPAAVLFAGNDTIICGQNNVALNGSIISGNVTSTAWSTNGSGTFGNASSLQTTYTPSAQDYASGTGSIQIYLNGTGSCSSLTDTIIVSFGIPITFSYTTYSDTCSAGVGAIQFSGVTGGNPPYVYTLNLTYNSISPYISYVNAGSYIAGVADTNGCYASQAVSIGNVTGNIPGIGITPDTSICPGSTIDITAMGGDSYIWYYTGNQDTTLATQTVTPNMDSYYYVLITKGACSQYDSILVRLDPNLNCNNINEINNNVFTPDGDGTNDVFVIDIGYLLNGNDNMLTVYNRWGDIINKFQNYNNVDVVWDGTNLAGEQVPAGTYFYVVEIPSINYSYSGWVQVLR